MATRNRVKDTDVDIVAFVEKGVRQGLKPAKIRRQMQEIPRFGGRIPEPRALQRLVADLTEIHGGNPKKVGVLDEPFEWNRLEVYGLPLEASSYILDIWVEQIEALPHVPELLKAWFPNSGNRNVISLKELYKRFHVTAREARWWWRIHQVDPDLDSTGVVALAKCYLSKEYYRDVIGLPLILSDLDAMLAYRPWASNTNSERYRSAVADGRIPRLQELKLSEAEYESAFGRMPFDNKHRNYVFRLISTDVMLDIFDTEEGTYERKH